MLSHSFMASTSQFRILLSNLSMESVSRHTCWGHSCMNSWTEAFIVPDNLFLPRYQTKEGSNIFSDVINWLCFMFVSGTNEILSSDVSSLPLSFHVCFDNSLFPLHLQCLPKCLAHGQPTKGFPSKWIFTGSPSSVLNPLCQPLTPTDALLLIFLAHSYTLWLQNTGVFQGFLLSLSLIPLYVFFSFFTHFTFLYLLLLFIFIFFRKWNSSSQGSG